MNQHHPLSTTMHQPWTDADAEALLTGMLSIFSPSGGEGPLARWLCTAMEPWGFTVEIDGAGNCIATLPATVATPAAPCVLLGHMDTVAGEIPVRREGDLLYGRGAVDAKGPLAAFLAATARVAHQAASRRRAVIIVGAVEEEAATSRGARAVLDRWQPAFTIIGEPSGANAVTLGYKGRLLVRFRATQAVAHTARPEEGVCARGVAFWLAVRQAATAWNDQYAAPNGQPSHFAALAPTLRALHSGSDGFTDWCEVEIGYRLPPNYDSEALQAWLTSAAQAVDGQATCRGAEAAFSVAPTGPLVSAFVRGMRAEHLTPTFKRKTGTSDMNIVGPVWHCPILAYGPGDAALDHTPSEHITLTEYHQGIAVLARVLSDLVTEMETTR